MGKHILIVEDEDDIRNILRDFFESEGYVVSTACHGREAFEILDRDPKKKTDLILLDLMMPVMNGEEFIMERKHHPDAEKIPFIIMSADNRAKNRVGLLGAQAYFNKPLELDQLVNEVKQCCRAVF